MSKIKSPLKHEEGNALAHAPYINEADWHEKNDNKEDVSVDTDQEKNETAQSPIEGPIIFTPTSDVNIRLTDLPKKEKEKNIEIEGTILDENDLETLKFIKDPEQRKKVKQNLINEKTKKEEGEVANELNKYKEAGKSDGSAYTEEELSKIEKRLKLNAVENRQSKEIIDGDGNKYDSRLFMFDRQYQPDTPVGGGSKAVKPAGTYETDDVVKIWDYYTQRDVNTPLPGNYYHPKLGFISEETFNEMKGDIDIESFIKQNNIKTPKDIKKIRAYNSVKLNIMDEEGELDNSTQLTAIADELKKLPGMGEITIQNDYSAESITLHATNLIGVKGPDGELLVDENGKKIILLDDLGKSGDIKINETELKYIADALEKRESTSILNKIGYKKEGELDNEGVLSDDAAINGDLRLLKERTNEEGLYTGTDGRVKVYVDDLKDKIQKSIDNDFNKYFKDTPYVVILNPNGTLGLVGSDNEFENTNELMSYVSNTIEEKDLREVKNNAAAAFGEVKSDIDEAIEKSNKEIIEEDLVNQYLLTKEGTTNPYQGLDYASGEGSLSRSIAEGLSFGDGKSFKGKNVLWWWANSKIEDKELTLESLYDEVFDQNFLTRPFNENVSGMSGEEQDMMHAEEAFELIKAIDDNYEKQKEKTRKTVENKKNLSIVDGLTEGTNKVIYSKDDNEVYVRDEQGDIVGVAKEEEIKKSEEQKLEVASDLSNSAFKKIDNTQLELQKLGYTDLNIQVDKNGYISKIDQMLWYDDDSEPDEKTELKAEKLKELTNKYIEGYNKTIDLALQEYENIYAARSSRIDDEKFASLINSREFIETSYGENWRRRFGSGVDNVVISIPALLGNDLAKEKLQQNADEVRFQKEYTWDDSPWYQNTGMVFADQGANMLYFMATMGAGTTLGATNKIAMGIAASGVGLQSAGQKRVQIETSQEQADIAKQNIINLDLALSQGLVTDEYYKQTRKNLDKVVDMGDMTNAQKWRSVVLTGIIEGGLTYAFGNIGRLNTAKNLNKFFTGTRSSTIRNRIMDYNKSAAIKEISRGVGIGLLGENAEEVSIYLATETVDAMVFERGGDYSQIGKVMIDASIMAGSSNTTSLTYSTVMNHSMRTEMRKNFKNRFDAINAAEDLRAKTKNELTKLKQEPNTKENRKKIKELESTISGLDIEVKTLQEQNIVDQQNYAVQVLGIDEETHKKIFETQSQLNNFYIQAGVDQQTLNDPDALNKKLQEYTDKLNTQKRGSGDTWLEGVTDLRKTLDDAQSNWSVETAANALYGENHKEDGSRKRLQEKLYNKTNTKTKEGKQRAEEHAKANEQNKLRIEMQFANELNLKRARASMENDENVRTDIEQKVFSIYRTDDKGNYVFDEKGMPIVEEYLDKEAFLKKNKQKRLTKKQREKLDATYNFYAKNYFAVSKKSMATFDQEGKTTKQVIDEMSAITGEDIVFDDVGSFDGLIKKVKELESNESIDIKEAKRLKEVLKNNRKQIETNSNGFLLGNKFFVIDGKKARASMKTGATENMILTGAVHVHETGHYLDNVTKSIKEISDKGQFIHEYLTNDKNYLSGQLNDTVESKLRRMSNKDGYYLGETETIQDIINERSNANTTAERQSRIDTILDEYIREVTTVLNQTGYVGLKNEIIENGRGFFARIKNRGYEVTNAREAIFEVASFLDAISKGKLSEAYRTQARIATAKDKKTAAQERQEMQLSSSVQEDINKLVRNKSGEVISKEQYDAKLKVRRKGKVNIADLISDRNETLNGLIIAMKTTKGKEFRIQGDRIVLVKGLKPGKDGKPPYITKAEFIQMVKDQLTTAVINYNPEVEYNNVRQGDLSGWLALHIMLKKPGVIDKIKKEQLAALAAQEGGIKPDDSRDMDAPEGTIIFAEKLGFEETVSKDENGKEVLDNEGNPVTRNAFDLIVEEKFDEILTQDIKTYNDVKSLLKAQDAVLVEALELVAEKFGVNPSKLIKDSQLTVSERLSIQKQIRMVSIRSILNMLPEGFNNQAEATGVPNVLLNAKNLETGEPNLIYTKREDIGRIKAGKKQRVGRRTVFVPKKKEGGGAGPILQQKNFVENINEADALNLFGITPVGVESRYNTENRQVDSPLRAIVMQAAMAISNQSIRKIAFERNYIGLETIKSGKGDLMFSSTIVRSNNSELQARYYQKQAEFHKNIDAQSLDLSDTKEGKQNFKQSIEQAYDKTWSKTGLLVDGLNYRSKVINDFVKLRERYINKIAQEAEKEGVEPNNIKTFLMAEDSKRDDGFDTVSKIMGVGSIANLFRNKETLKEHKRFQVANAVAYGKKYNLTPDQLVSTFIRHKNFLENGTASPTRGMTFGDLETLVRPKEEYTGQHKKVFVKEFLNPIYGDAKTVVDYETKTDKQGRSTVVIKFEDKSSTTVDVIRSYPQATNIQMLATTNKNGDVELNMTQEEINGRKIDSEEALEFYDNYTALVAEQARSIYGENSQKAKEHFAMHVASMNANMKTPLRRGGIFTYAALDAPANSLKNEFGGKNFEFEHGMPAKVVNAMTLYRHWYGRDISLDDIKQAYRIGVLHVDFNDNVGRLFKDRMHFGYEFGDSAEMRWFNNFTRLGASHKLYNVFTGDIIGAKQTDLYNKRKESNKAFQASKAVENARLINYKTPSRGMSAFDFDETLIDKGENTIIATKGDDVVEISSGNWPLDGPRYAAEGYEFDFSDFINVKGGVEGPLMQKFRNRIKKYGIENNYILTARPAEAAPAIQAWLKTQGIDMPLENITGLGNSTGEAKAMWMAGKYAEGYNDMYFVDDALPNVQAVKDMMEQLDIKGSSVQAKIQFSSTLDTEFNNIIEQTTGIESQKVFSETQAKLRGRKTKYKSIVPASAQDFGGLLYNFLGKGKVGEKQMEFFKKALIDPFARGIDELNASKQAAANDYKNLLKQYPEIRKDLKKDLDEFEGYEGVKFTVDQAVRVYLWNKAGFDVPGLSARDLNTLDNFVKNDSELQAFADAVGLISKKEQGYAAPGEYWLTENINSDLMSDGAIGEVRADFLAEWTQNKNEIFNQNNLNKIEAIYGSKFVEALKDVLYRMETGRNRPTGKSRLTNEFMNWTNGSIGAIMFFNIRSAVLQTISSVNYINWTDNNPLRAAAAFANQKQYWKDFAFLFNSNYLKQRRAGNQRGINEAELSQAVAGKGAYEQAKAAIRYLLKIGFLPTQIADSFAIASGGATFYRNRIKKYIKEGMDANTAQERAFLDFQETTEVSQQSARPDMISQQQADPMGRLILSFQNTPMQYARIMNKAARDLVNGRGDYKTHISKIIYYGAIQGIIFGALQSALFAAIGDEEEDEEMFDTKKERILNQMIDSVLSGIGYAGKAISTAKNTMLEYLKQRDKGYRADHAYTIIQALGFAPPIGSKARKIYSAIQTEKFNREVFKKRGLAVDNPIWSAVGNIIEGTTNLPLGRAAQKLLNLENALDSQNETWERIALALGWSTWDLGITDPDIAQVKEDIKEEKKILREQEKERKKKEKEVEEKIENEAKEKANKELQKKEKEEGKKVLCAAINKSGKRCGKEILPGQTYCTIHEKVEQNETGEKKQCAKIKSNGKRCKMQTNSKSGLCYYHD